MEHTEGKFKGMGGIELFYQRWQPAGDPRATVAIVHGFGEHSGRYMNVVNCLAPAGYAVYGFDHRGHGRSPGQRGHIMAWTEYREDVRAFLKIAAEQEPKRPLFLMGHSLGGLIVLEYVLRYPDGLQGVIASSPLLAQPGVSPILIMLARLLSRIYPNFSLKTGLDASGISRAAIVVKTYVDDPLVHSLATPRLSTEISAAQAWSVAHAAELKLPLLMILGSADRLAPPEGGRKFFSQVTFTDKELHEYKDAFHECHNDIIYQEVVADLKRWLDAHVRIN